MKFPPLSGAGCLAFIAVILAVPAGYATEEHTVSSHQLLQGGELDLVSSASSSMTQPEEPHSLSNISSSRFLAETSSLTVVEPTTGCEDTTLNFIVSQQSRNCAWVADNWRNRCKLLRGRVRHFCPDTCNRCRTLACTNPKTGFYLETGEKRNCNWVKKKKRIRCKLDGVASTCRLTCSEICQWPIVNFVNNPCTDIFGSGQCEECSGDCDEDNDCAGDMRCAQRYAETDTVENVPGCRWGKQSESLQAGDDDYCFMPKTLPGIVNYVGECGSEGYKCGECEGDCDDDTDCADGLECFQRSGAETVPGCTGEGGNHDMFQKDICYKPVLPEINYVGNPCNDAFDSGFCEICTGDCDSDSDCEGSLRCGKRRGSDSVENVPGCAWPEGSEDWQAGDDDFCFMPESVPGEVNYVGECGSEGYKCGECEGDCDDDNDCEEGLVCSQRDGFEEVSGCSGAGGSRDVYAKDICYKPYVPEINYVGNPCNDAFLSGFCEVCTGDCDSDSDCEGNLRCAHRSSGTDEVQNVPGCAWPEGSEDWQAGDDDYCFMPESTSGEINYVGECVSEGYKCGECEGDCDDDNDCEEGLVCSQRDGFEDVTGCSGAGGSRDVYGKDICYRPNPVQYIDSLRDTGDGSRCAGPCTIDDDCDGTLQCFQRDGTEYVPGCVTGGIGDISGMNYCHKAPPNGNPTYIPGMLTVNDIENGLELSQGLSARLIASAGQVVDYANGGTSSEVFHYKPDGAAVFNVTSGPNAGGWIYASNSETSSDGGVGALTFDAEGNVINYERIVVNTRRNCGGGKTYWGTWVTCEEYGSTGQVWEVDPAVGLSSQQQTVIGGIGGNYEAFAYDARERLNPTFYVTHDASSGGTVRFTPDPQTVLDAEESGDYSNVLTTDGTLEWLVLSPEFNNKEDRRGTFHWSNSRSEGDASASQFYRYAEGIDIRNGFLYMTTKADKYLFILDLDNLTYERSSTVSGAFEGQPDQIASIVAGNPLRDMLYFCEEASPINNGVHARDTEGNFYTIINAPGISGETTGLDFSPDNTRMYVSYQGPGLIFEITRDDGYPFGAHRLDIKYHAD